MNHVRERDLRTVLTILADVYAQPDLDAYARLVVEALPDAIAAQRVSYNEIHPRTGTIRAVVRPADPYPWLNGRLYSEHPMMQRFVTTGDGRAHKISDFLARDALHRTALYQEYYRLVGVEHQMAVFLTAPGPRSVGFALSRDLCDFTERDRSVLDLLRPHLARAYERASATARLHGQMTLLARAADAAASGIVLLGRRGRVDYSTRRARHWLREYFPRRGRPSASRLPAMVEEWLASRTAGPSEHDRCAPPPPLVVTRQDRQLVIRLVGGPGEQALLLEESRSAFEVAALAPLGLSARESEVLALVAAGDRNDAIARTLGTSPRTIAKHVERIHRKLGVDNRAAAAARAHDVAAAPSRLAD
jgi:DNA-binding CsgD family transcriptional regulator